MNLNQFRQAYNNERTRVHDLNSVAATYAEVPGRVMINAAGEAYVDVNFGVKFTSLPYFKSGFEMQEGSGIISGRMPTGEAYVAEWKTTERLPFSVFYSGARIHIVTTGLFYQKMLLNYSFTGIALSNPSI